MKIIKKILSFFREFDFFWSLPLAFIGFIFYPVIGEKIWGEGFTGYSPEFFQAGLYAGLIAILFNSLTQMAIYINFPELYKYYLKDGFQELPTWIKILSFLFVYCLFYFSLLTIWRVVV